MLSWEDLVAFFNQNYLKTVVVNNQQGTLIDLLHEGTFLVHTENGDIDVSPEEIGVFDA